MLERNELDRNLLGASAGPSSRATALAGAAGPVPAAGRRCRSAGAPAAVLDRCPIRWAGASGVSPYRCGGLLERAWRELAQIVNMVVLKQLRHALAPGWPHRNLQQQATAPLRLIVDLEGCLAATPHSLTSWRATATSKTRMIVCLTTISATVPSR